MEPYLLSIVEVARRLGIGRSSCYELLAERNVAVVKIGRRALVPESEAKRLADELIAEAKVRAEARKSPQIDAGS